MMFKAFLLSFRKESIKKFSVIKTESFVFQFAIQKVKVQDI